MTPTPTTKRAMRRTALAAAVTIALVGCSGFNDDRGKGDAPIANKGGDDSGAYLVNFPDGFSNVAHKCLGGNGIYTTTRDAAPVVVPDDPECAK